MRSCARSCAGSCPTPRARSSDRAAPTARRSRPSGRAGGDSGRRDSGASVVGEILDRLYVALRGRIGLQPDLLAPDGDGLLDLVVDEDLLEPHALRPLRGPGGERHLFLRARHRGVGLLVRRGRPVAAVVLVQEALLLLAQLDVRIDVRRLVEERPVVRNNQVVAVLGHLAQRDDGLARPEQAALDAAPCGATAVAVEVQLAKLAELLAVAVADGAPAPAECGVDVWSAHVRDLPGAVGGKRSG